MLKNKYMPLAVAAIALGLAATQSKAITVSHEDSDPGKPSHNVTPFSLDIYESENSSFSSFDLPVHVDTGYLILLEKGPSTCITNWSDVVYFDGECKKAYMFSVDEPLPQDQATQQMIQTALCQIQHGTEDVKFVQEGPASLGIGADYTAGKATYHIQSEPLPEPASLALIPLALGGMALRKRLAK